MRWREHEGVRWLEAELPGARAAFTTRLGGVSDGPYESLNLGWLTDDEPAMVRVNRELLARALGRRSEDFLVGRQVHGAELAWHDGVQADDPYMNPVGAPEVDAHATAEAGLAPMVIVADCLPVALAGPSGVAMLHCGWRGLAANLIAKGARAVEATAAAIGPGIGPCCYEVGDEVRARFADLGPDVVAGRNLDLPEIAARQLEAAGVMEIERARECTSCNPELFFSHRRDAGKTGRQAGVIWRES
jgi:hypothetical protein